MLAKLHSMARLATVGPSKGNLAKIKWDKNYLTKMAPHSHYLKQKPKIKIHSNGCNVPP